MYIRTLIAILFVAGCSGDQDKSPKATMQSAFPADPSAIQYLGEGELRVPQGTMAARAQLELLPGDGYRLLVLEPAILAMTGVEEGVFERTAQGIVLRPEKTTPPPNSPLAQNGGSVFRSLREGSPGQVKTLTTPDNGESYHLAVEGLHLSFARGSL